MTLLGLSTIYNHWVEQFVLTICFFLYWLNYHLFKLTEIIFLWKSYLDFWFPVLRPPEISLSLQCLQPSELLSRLDSQTCFAAPELLPVYYRLSKNVKSKVHSGWQKAVWAAKVKQSPGARCANNVAYSAGEDCKLCAIYIIFSSTLNPISHGVK